LGEKQKVNETGGEEHSNKASRGWSCGTIKKVTLNQVKGRTGKKKRDGEKKKGTRGGKSVTAHRNRHIRKNSVLIQQKMRTGGEKVK